MQLTLHNARLGPPARLSGLAGEVVQRSPAIVVLLFAGCYLPFFLRASWGIGDEGSIVYGAQRVAEGAVPYRDFFEVMGPGAFYWLAFWFKLFGTSWLTSRAAVLTTALASAWAIHYLASRQCRHGFALFPAVLYTVLSIPLWPGANHHFDSNLWVLLGIAAVAHVPELDITRGLIAGVLLGLSSTIMPQKGVLVLAALAAAIVLRSRADGRLRRVIVPMSGMALGFGAVGLGVVGFFWANGAFEDLWYATVVWPVTQYHEVNVVPYAYGLREWFRPVWQSILQSRLSPDAAAVAVAGLLAPLIFAAALPALVIGWLAWRLAMQRRIDGQSHHDVPWMYGVTGLALFAAEGHRPDITHVIYGSPLLAIALTTFLANGRSFVFAAVRRGLACSLAILAAFLLLVATAAAIEVQTRRGPVFMPRDDETLRFIQENLPPRENVFIYPYYPMYYFLADITNPTRYSILMYHVNTKEQFEEVIDALETKRVSYVLHDRIVAGGNLTRWFPRYIHPSADGQLLERYLAGRYREVAVTSRFRILQRTDTASSQHD